MKGVITLPGPEERLYFGGEIVEVSPVWRSHKSFSNRFCRLVGPVFVDSEEEYRRLISPIGYQLRHGWFKTGLQSEKFCSRFKQFCDFDISGYAEIEGKYDLGRLQLNFEGRDFKVASSAFEIDVPSISSNPFGGHYVIDFQTGDTFGWIPVVDGTYRDRYKGLVFSELTGKLFFDGQKIHIPTMEGFCHGIYLLGTIEFDASQKKSHELLIELETVSGTLSEANQFLSHFDVSHSLACISHTRCSKDGQIVSSDDSRSNEGKVRKPCRESPLEPDGGTDVQIWPAHCEKYGLVPFDGQFTCSEKGARVHFDIGSDETVIETAFYGSVVEGELTHPKIHLADLGFNFMASSNDVEISDLQGVVLLGEPGNEDEYLLVGDMALQGDFSSGTVGGTFDVWVGDKRRDVIRLAGSVETGANGLNHFEFDRNLTHFGVAHPSELKLSLKDWSDLAEFNLAIQCETDKLFGDFKYVLKTGLIPIPRGVFDQLNRENHLGGIVDFEINFDPVKSQFQFMTCSDAIVFGEKIYHNVLLHGTKRGTTWSVEELCFNDVSVACAAKRLPDRWEVGFLGLTLGDALMAGIKGNWLDDDNYFEGKIHLFETDIAKLDAWLKKKGWFKDWDPTGLLRAEGKIKVESSPQFGWVIDADLLLALKSWGILGLTFDDIENVNFQFSSQKIAQFQNVKTKVKMGSQDLFSFFVDKGKYDFKTDQFSLEGFRFSIPPTELKKVFDSEKWMQTTGSVEEIIDGLSDNLSGVLDFDLAYPHLAFKAKLDPGTYSLFGIDYPLESLVIEYDPMELNVCSKLPFFWVVINCPGNRWDFGKVSFYMEDPEVSQEVFPLTFDWKLGPQKGFSIERGEGKFCGLDVNLKRDESRFSDHFSYLIGNVNLNGFELSGIKEIFGWYQIGEGYSFKGKWAIDPSFDFEFDGICEGKNCSCMGYLFDSFFANVKLSPGKIHFNEIALNDPGLTLGAESLTVFDEQFFSLPDLKITNLRPSRLKAISETKTDKKSRLVVKELNLRNLCGTVGQPISYQGEGELFFRNSVKKIYDNTLFQIPGEIVSRLGLDLSVLTPVTGHIYYEIREGKIFLVKLKDIYSEKKLSKFILSNDPLYPSYMGFNGDLHLKIKMKHYNLLFKISELLTVTVGGTYANPKYTIQK